MTNECGAGISHDEYAGELIFHTDIIPLFIPRCTVTITPKTINELVPNRILFYFTDYMMQQECWKTNLTIRDGTSIHHTGVEGLPQHLCSYKPVETNKVYTTLTSSLTVVYTTDTFRGTSNNHFVIKYLAYHTGQCSSTNEHECNNGHCIPSTYYCSPDINACNQTDQDCSSWHSDQATPFNSIFTSIVVIFIIIVMFSICKAFLKKLKEIIGKMIDSCTNCFSIVKTKCRGCTCSIPQSIVRIVHFICHICKKDTTNPPRCDENDSGATTVNTVTTPSEQPFEVITHVQHSNSNVTQGGPDSQVLRQLQILDILDSDIHTNNEQSSPTGSPPDYEDLFFPEPPSDPRVDVESTPDVVRRLQTECGFEHPFDFETEFDYYYSTDSDWETDSTSTDNVLPPLQTSVNMENPQTNETPPSVGDDMMPYMDVPSVDNGSDPLQPDEDEEFASSNIDSYYGSDEITPPSVNATETMPSEPPPPYDDTDISHLPDYYDYIANVSLYKH